MKTNSDIEQLRNIINQELILFLPEKSSIAELLVQAMHYSVMGGGKRIRPILALATCESTGTSITNAIGPACAIELIHAYSLIHDDLPAMDDDELRHGQASTHVRFGQAQAILAGDALQSLAFQIISDPKGLSTKTKIDIIQILSTAIGWKGMAGGQSMDIESENFEPSLTEIKALHKAKTGALIQASVQIGAISSNKIEKTSKEFLALSKFGSLIGLAFQIVDDLLDVSATSEELGKPSHSDQKNEKKTFIDILGFDQSAALANKITQDGILLLKQTGLNVEVLESIALQCMNRAN